MAESKYNVKTGIAAIPLVNPGTHICHFYKNTQELLSVIVPYIMAGLLGNEKCMWITANPVSIKQAITELGHKISNINDYRNSGQLFVASYKDWYTKLGKFYIDDVLLSWTEAESKALDEGYNGIRVVGVMSWVKRKDWDTIVHYESVADSVLKKCHMISLCSYPLCKLETDKVLDLASNHAMFLVNSKGGLMAIGNSRRAKLSVMKASNLTYEAIGKKIGISRQRAHQILNKRKISLRTPNILTSSEAASILNIHINTLRRWSNLGVLPVYRIGLRGDRRFKRKDIDKLVLKWVSDKNQVIES